MKTETRLADWFETRTRDNGDTFVTLKDGRPEWLYDAVREAHGELLPDDYIYQWAEYAAEWLEDCEDLDLDPRDYGERVDTLVPVYNADRIDWLASNLTRAGQCDDAAAELGEDSGSIFERIGLGMYYEIHGVFDCIVDAWEQEQEG